MPTQTQLLVDTLTEAREAYHALVTGQAARVVVDQNGERVEFVAANRAALYKYIMDLESKLGIATSSVNGPAGFVF